MVWAKKYDPSLHHRRSIRLSDYDYSQCGLYFITMCCNNRRHLFGEVINGAMQLNNAGRIAHDHLNALPERYPESVLVHEFVVMPNHVHVIIEIKNTVGAIHESPLPASPKQKDSNGDEKDQNNRAPVGAIHESPLRESPLPASPQPSSPISESPLRKDSDSDEDDQNNRALVGAIRESPIRESSLGESSLGESPLPASSLGESPLPASPQQDELPKSIPNKRDQRRKMLLSKVIGWYKMNTAKQINLQQGASGQVVWQRNYFEHIVRNEKSLRAITEYIKQNPIRWRDDRFYQKQ